MSTAALGLICQYNSPGQRVQRVNNAATDIGTVPFYSMRGRDDATAGLVGSSLPAQRAHCMSSTTTTKVECSAGSYVITPNVGMKDHKNVQALDGEESVSAAGEPKVTLVADQIRKDKFSALICEHHALSCPPDPETCRDQRP